MDIEERLEALTTNMELLRVTMRDLLSALDKDATQIRELARLAEIHQQ